MPILMYWQSKPQVLNPKPVVAPSAYSKKSVIVQLFTEAYIFLNSHVAKINIFYGYKQKG